MVKFNAIMQIERPDLDDSIEYYYITIEKFNRKANEKMWGEKWRITRAKQIIGESANIDATKKVMIYTDIINCNTDLCPPLQIYQLQRDAPVPEVVNQNSDCSTYTDIVVFNSSSTTDTDTNGYEWLATESDIKIHESSQTFFINGLRHTGYHKTIIGCHSGDTGEWKKGIIRRIWVNDELKKKLEKNSLTIPGHGPRPRMVVLPRPKNSNTNERKEQIAADEREANKELGGRRRRRRKSRKKKRKSTKKKRKPHKKKRRKSKKRRRRNRTRRR